MQKGKSHTAHHIYCVVKPLLWLGIVVLYLHMSLSLYYTPSKQLLQLIGGLHYLWFASAANHQIPHLIISPKVYLNKLSVRLL